MQQSTICQEIAESTAAIVNPDSSVEQTQNNVAKLSNLLGQVSAIQFDKTEQNTGSSDLVNGLALSPLLAASCATNHIRTQKFHRGVNQYLREMNNDNGPIKILYAGSGPYAALLFPILFLHPDLEINVCILDIHDTSIAGVKKLFEIAAFNHVAFEAYTADATRWQPADKTQRFDLILSETMDRGLKHEPQVSIFKHLCQFLKPTGQLIPEQISIYSGLQSGDKHCELGPLFRLNKSTSKALLEENQSHFDGEITLPRNTDPYTRMVISTEIHIYGEHYLRPNESEMTTDFSYRYLDLKDKDSIKFRYVMEQDPGFEFTLPYYQAPVPPEDFAIATQSGTPYLYLFWHSVIWDFHKPRIEKKNRNLNTWLTWDNVLLMMDAYNANLQETMAQMLEVHPPSFERFENWFLDRFGKLCQQDALNLNQQITKNHQAFISS